MRFDQLHEQNSPLIICNVWDVVSAKIADKLGFNAIGTSSAAIATMLGYEDGEQMSFPELIYIVKRIKENTALPLTVDIETGYGRNSEEIADHINALSNLGVVGINIEDSNVNCRLIANNQRVLLNADEFTQKLYNIKQILLNKNVEIFINVRTDTFLLGVDNAVEETIKRIKLYQSAGADGIFVPCIDKNNDISSVINGTKLPVNVMCMPNLPDFNTLKMLGVKRISMGNFIFDNLANHLKNTLHCVLETQSFKSIF